MTPEFIAQSIVRAPDFWGTTLRMAMFRTQHLLLRTKWEVKLL